MSMTTANSDLLIRSEIWSRELKEVLLDELMAQKYVRWLSEFPDGTTFTIPSIGQATVRDYVENDPIIFDALDTGEFQFSITEYLSSAHYITDKLKQDSFYSSELVSGFVPKEQRAIMEHVETKIFALQSQQTASDPNSINGAAHRFVGSGTSSVIAPADFAKAKYALQKAKVPMTNLIAIVDPSVEYTLSTLSNLVNVSNNPKWEGIVRDGMSTGMRFVMNVYGFDVYTSDYLAKGLTETVSSVSVTSDGVANIFCSATADVLPFIGAWRQMPRVESERNMQKQRDEMVTTARYGVKLYRPENFVVALTKGTV